MCLSRRALLELTGAAALGTVLPAREPGASPEPALPAPVATLKPMTAGMAPIAKGEHESRIARAQGLLGEAGLDALVLASGSSLEYFTGAAWGLSERFFGMVLPREGDAGLGDSRLREGACPRAGPDRGRRERAWEEHESPFALVATALRDRKATGRIAIEEAVPFVFADGIGQALPTARLVSGTPVTAGCRMVKDAHELALMRRACEVTVRAHRAVFASLARRHDPGRGLGAFPARPTGGSE